MKRLASLALVALVAVIPLRAGASGATFVAASANPGSSVATAADFNTVAVAMTDPGANLRGTVTLTATAASDRGIANVSFQTAPAGGAAWTTACVTATAPYTCSFDTTTVADGPRDVRAVATDTAGYARSATVGSRRVDNIAPTTSLTDPGTPLTGSKTLSATAADAGSGVASATLQYRASGASSWTDACAAASCSLNTATLADGLYDLRSLVADVAGNTNTSVVSARRVDNTAPTAALTMPAYVRGTIALSATTSDGNGAGVASVKYQTRPSGGSPWTDACTGTTSCSFATTGLADGLYDVQAIATDGAGFTTTSALATTRVDNAAPSSATLANPGASLSGTVTLTATAADAGSGLASVQFQSAPTGTSTWTTQCADATSTYSCAWNTTTMTDGVYDLRVVAADNAGNTLSSATLSGKRVDNIAPALTFTDPGARVHGTITLAAAASDGGGVASVLFQHKLSAASTWTSSCTADATSPYSCALNTTTLTNGSSYDFRATATDNAGRTTVTAYTARVVDNTAPTGTNVQTTNGGTARKIDAGDTLTFTYSEAMAPSSILSGWDGTAVGVNVHVTDSGTADLLSVYDSAGSAKLNLTGATDLQLKANRVTANAVFAATMTMSGSSVVVTFGAATSGSSVAVFTTTAMVWTPSASATDLAGNPAATTPVTESGTADVDF